MLVNDLGNINGEFPSTVKLWSYITYRSVVIRGNPTILKLGEVLIVFCNFEGK